MSFISSSTSYPALDNISDTVIISLGNGKYTLAAILPSDTALLICLTTFRMAKLRELSYALLHHQ